MIVYSDSKSQEKDVFEYLGYYPKCDFILHHVFGDDWSTIPNRPDLPLLLWHAGEAFIEDTSEIKRDFVYVTGNASLPYHFSLHDIAATKIWPKNNPIKNIKKPFLFLNGKDVGHRRYILSYLYDNNLLDKCTWTYIKRQDADLDWWFDPALGFTDTDLQFANNSSHLLPYTPFDKTTLIRNLDQEIYNNTGISIVGETTFQHYRTQAVPLMLTEKTYSAIANLHAFIIAGPVGSLKYLKEQGYKTFSDIWDEDYDYLVNTADRLKRVCETIQQASKLDPVWVFEKTRDRLHHNQDLLYSIDVKARVNKVTDWLTCGYKP